MRCAAHFSRYHLNRQRYPNIVSSTISTMARTTIGHEIPSIIPRQNVKMASPTAFDAPRIQIFTIASTPLIYSMLKECFLCDYVKIY